MLSFVEKRNFFQRLSITSDNIPNAAKWTQEVSLDDIPMAHGEIVNEQISFEDRLKMFEPDEDKVRRNLLQNGKQDQTVYRYDFTKSEKDASPLEGEMLGMAKGATRVSHDNTSDVASLETVEREVTTLLAEVHEEEKKLSSAGAYLLRDDSTDEHKADSFITSTKLASTVSTDESPDFAQVEGFSQSNGCDIDTPNSETEDHLKEIEPGPVKEDFDERDIVRVECVTALQGPLIHQQESENVEEGVADANRQSTKALVTQELRGESSKVYTGICDTTFKKLTDDRSKDVIMEEEDKCTPTVDYNKDNFREALQLEDYKSEYRFESQSTLPPRDLFVQNIDISAVVKSQILEEELGQSIEESPLEVKYIAEDIERMTELRYEGDAYKHIKAEIFTQQVSEDIESGSPERKDISPVSGEAKGFGDSKPEVDDSDQEESAGISAAEDISQNIEHDDLEDYEEARDEHSLSEQLLALASNTSPSVRGIGGNNPEFCASEDVMRQNLDSFLSKRVPHGDINICRKSKNGMFSRSDKKEIRSLKTTKQVSTIEEHSSIESSDSPLELIHPEISEDILQTTEKALEDVTDDSKIEVKESDKEQILPNFKDLPTLSIARAPSEDSSGSPEKPPTDKPDVPKLPSPPSSDDKSSKGSKKSDSDSDMKKPPGPGELVVSGRRDESFSSSGEVESHYYSAEASDSGKSTHSTPRGSRPCSSEFDVNVLSGQASEYETCVTSQNTSGEGSYATAATSQETSYSTAYSSLSHSSRESAYSVDSESSGNLASIEASSEASETLVPSAQEMELEFPADIEMPVLDEEPPSPTELKEPYDMEIPESIIRSGIELPFMKNWDMHAEQSTQWGWQFATERELPDTFEEMQGADGGDVTPMAESSYGAAAAYEPPSESDGACRESITNLPPSTYFSACSTGEQSERKDKEDEELDEKDDAKTRSPFLPETRSAKFSVGSSRDGEPSSTSLEEEQHSVSESSMTHSEHTWQTSSVDTAVQLSGHVSTACLVPETQNAVSLTDSLSDIPPEMGSSLEQMPVQVEQPSSYLQLNGPVEVEYNPEYDASDGESEPPENLSPSVLQPEELQFELEEEAHPIDPNEMINGHVENQHENGNDADGLESCQFGDNCEALQEFENFEASGGGTFAEADQPESQQEQSLGYRDYEEQMRSERIDHHYQISYLPESDQGNLQSEGSSDILLQEESILHPSHIEESSPVLNIAENVEPVSTMPRSDSADKAEIVDTSPEDERYDFQSQQSPRCAVESEYLGERFESRSDSHILEEIASQELYTHEEAEELELKEADMFPGSFPDDDKSTPSFENIPSRRFFPRSGETSAASSLQEFERIEADIAAGQGSHGSTDSYEKPSIKRLFPPSGGSSVASSLQEFERLEADIAAGRCSQTSVDSKASTSKSSEHDDISMSSLTEFEKLEKECVSGEQVKSSCDPMLSEIDEGPESQASELQEASAHSRPDNHSDDSDYEKRMTEIEEIIKIAESNVEKFHEEVVEDISEGMTYEEFTVSLNTDESDGNHPQTKDSELAKELELTRSGGKCANKTDEDNGHDSSSNSSKNGRGDCMLSSTDSVDPSSSTATHATYQFETDSVMSSSINSAQASGEEGTMVSSTDTLEPEAKLTYSQGDLASDDNTEATGGIVHESSGVKISSHEYSSGDWKSGSCSHDSQHMEMFLTRLTDDSEQPEDEGTSGLLQSELSTFADTTNPIELSDPSLSIIGQMESAEISSGTLMPDEGESGDEDVRTTTTTTTRIVTTVTTGDDEQGDEAEGAEELRSSVEAVLNQFMTDDPSSQKSESQK